MPQKSGKERGGQTQLGCKQQSLCGAGERRWEAKQREKNTKDIKAIKNENGTL